MHFTYTQKTRLHQNLSIEQCEQYGHGISFEGVASLIKAAHRNGDTNITQREIYLGYDLKDKKESILINHSNFFWQITY